MTVQIAPVLTAPASAPSAAGFARSTALISGRVLRQFVRSRMMLIVTVVFPLLQLLMLLAAFGVLVDHSAGIDYVSRLAPLIVLTTAFSSIMSTAIALWTDIRSGVFNRLRAMPIDIRAYLFGRLGGDLVRIVVVAVVVCVVGYCVGFRFTRGVGATIGFFAVVAMFGAMCSVLAVAVAVSAQHPGIIVRWVQMPTLVLTLMSVGYVPLSAFPSWLRPVIEVNPVSLAAQALAALAGGGPVVVPLLGTSAWSVGAIVVGTVVTTRRFASLVERG